MAKQKRAVESKPSISVVGAGRLGTALAVALEASGYRIEALVARQLGRARKAAGLFAQRPLALSASQLDKLPESHLILITTPDDAITTAADRLAVIQKPQGRSRMGRTVLHTSGALSSAALSPLSAAGFQVGSLHPLVSVSDPVSGQLNLRGAFYCLEGDRLALRVARAVVRDLGGKSFSVDPQGKALYHAAAVMASGHMVALFDIAAEMLTACGLDRRSARRVLRPLLQSTVKNLSSSDPAGALTGTFARGDFATVQRHLQALRTAGSRDAIEAYNLLGHRSLELARENGTHPAVLKKIAKALKQAMRGIGS